MKIPFNDYLQRYIKRIEMISDKGLLSGLGELMDDEMNQYVRMKLRSETIRLLEFYRAFPIIK